MTWGQAGIPLPHPRLTPALEKSQMFFGKRPAQAEAVGSLLLTQTRCLAPGLILPWGRAGVPMGVAASSLRLSRGVPAPGGGLRSRRPGGHRTRHGSTVAASAQGSAGIWQQVGNLRMCVICITYACHLRIMQRPHHVCDPVISLHTRVSHVPQAQPLG